MTDRGTRVRWTTAALVAPTAAALFTGTTVWAAGHQPLTAAKPTAAGPTATASVDPAIVELRAQIDANSAKVDKLRTTVATLTARAAAVAGGSSARVSTTTKSSTTRSSSTKSSSSSSTKRTSNPKKTVHVATPAPPPAPNTTPGASGAVT